MPGGLLLSSTSPLPLASRAVKPPAAPWPPPPSTGATRHRRAQGHFGIQHCCQKASPKVFKTFPNPLRNLSQTSPELWSRGSPSAASRPDQGQEPSHSPGAGARTGHIWINFRLCQNSAKPIASFIYPHVPAASQTRPFAPGSFEQEQMSQHLLPPCGNGPPGPQPPKRGSPRCLLALLSGAAGEAAARQGCKTH